MIKRSNIKDLKREIADRLVRLLFTRLDAFDVFDISASNLVHNS